MSEVKFKVGDLVYYPNISNKIGKIVGTSVIANDPYCLKVAIDDTVIFVTKDGKFAVNAPIAVIYHANQENYEWLSATFPNVAFEPPPKRKEPREIVKAMLESGWDCVPCFVSDDDKMTAIKKGNRVLIDMESIYDWAFCIPFHHKTGKTIIDFVDGEVILESEND